MQFLLVFAVALVVRLIHVWQMRPSPYFDVLMGDANGYDLWAQRLAAGDWIGTEVFYQAPLYPYFLGVIYSVFGHDLLAVRVIQAVIGSASCVLLGMAGTRFFSKKVGLVAGLGLALWAPAIFFDGLLQKAVLDVFLVCLALWLLSAISSQQSASSDQQSATGNQRQSASRYWLALGLTIGALALTRENALIFVVVIALWAGSSRWFGQGSSRWFRTVVPFAAGVAVVLMPVVARNYAVDGGFYLTTSQFGPNFYIGNNAEADGTYASLRFGRGAPEYERVDATEIAEASVGRALSPAEVSSFWTGRALGYITAEPLDWLRLTGRKVLLLVNRSEMIDTESQESHAEWSAPLRWLGWIGHFGLLVPLAVLGLFLTWPGRLRGDAGGAAAERPGPWILHALLVTYALSVVMFYVFARYRYPLVPFLLLFAAVPFDSPQRTLRALWLDQSQRRRRWLIVAATAAVAVAANRPMASAALMRAITENNLGTALQERKRYDEAIAHHQRAIALAPDQAPAYNNLGAALRAAGRTGEAIAAYRKALELKADFPSARYNLANALLEQGEAGASVEQFTSALALSPQSVEAQNNLGIALARKGDTAGAMAAFRAALAIDERSVHAHRNLGNMLIDSGARAEGLRHLERAIALAPNEPDATYDVGTVLLEDQDFAAAAARFAAALTLRPDWPEAHNNLGIALASQGRIADALTHFERALQLRPDFQDARANRDQARAVLKK